MLQKFLKLSMNEISKKPNKTVLSSWAFMSLSTTYAMIKSCAYFISH